MDSEAARDAGEALRDPEVPLHGRSAVGQPGLGDEDRIVRMHFSPGERVLQGGATVVRDRDHDLLPRFALHEPNPALLEIDVAAGKRTQISRTNARFERDDEEIL